MRRKKQCQHIRKIRTKSGVRNKIINPGRRKKRKILFKSTRWKDLARAGDMKKDIGDFDVNPDGSLNWHDDPSLDNEEVLKYIDWNKGIPEMRRYVDSKQWTPNQERQFRNIASKRNKSRKDYGDMLKSLPQAGRIFVNLSGKNYKNIMNAEKNKKPRIARKKR